MPDLSATARKVEEALAARGMPGRVRELATSTRSAADAAAAIGCEVSQIAKSLVFRTEAEGEAVLVIASGSNRVDEQQLALVIGARINRPDAAFVRAATGFAIGGVAPVGHTGPVRIFIDADLDQYAEIWAAAGSPNAVFRLTPADLRRVTGGQVLKVT